MQALLNRVREILIPDRNPKPPTLVSYGHIESGLDAAAMQSVAKWVFLTLFNSEYFGRAHLFYLQQDAESADIKEIRRIYRQGEPVLGYRCGDRNPRPPAGLYWKLVPEHDSLRIYHLVEKDD